MEMSSAARMSSSRWDCRRVLVRERTAFMVMYLRLRLLEACLGEGDVGLGEDVGERAVILIIYLL